MNAQVPNGLTLESLAQRLGALERENDVLRSKAATLEGSDTRRSGGSTPAFEGHVSRRALLSKASEIQTRAQEEAAIDAEDYLTQAEEACAMDPIG
jgi:hypothetical protein